MTAKTLSMARRTALGRLPMYAFLALFVYLTLLAGVAVISLGVVFRIFHQVVVTILLGTWLIGLLLRREGLPALAIEKPLLVLLGLRFLSGITGVDPRMSLELFWRPLIHTVALFWLVCVFRRRGSGQVIRAFYLSAGVVCIVGLAELVAWYVGLSPSPASRQGWIAIGGIFDPFPPAAPRLSVALSNANVLAAYLSLLVAPALAMALNARRRGGRVAWLAWIAAALVVQYFTRSRGGLLGLSVSLVVCGLGAAAVRRESVVPLLTRLRRPKVIWLAGISLMLSIAGVAAYVLPAYLRSAAGVVDRLRLWWCAVGMFVERPLTGIGIGAYGHALGNCPAFSGIPVARIGTAHNLYLNIAAESGLLALAALLWLLVALLRSVWRRWQNARSDSERILIVGLGSSLVGFGANCMVESIPETHLVLPVLVVIAWLIAPVRVAPAKPGRRTAGVVVALAILLVYAAGLLWTDRGRWYHERSMQAAGRGELELAVAEIDMAQSIDPSLGVYRFQRAYYLGVLAEDEPDGYLGSALEASTEALAWDDTYSIHLANLAALHWQAGDRNQAIAVMERAVETNPPSAGNWLNLGLMLELAGEEDQALLAYASALGEAPSWAGSGFWQASAFRRQQWQTTVARSPEPQEPISSGLWLAAGDFVQALQAAGNPETAQDYTDLGLALTGLGRFDEARSALDEAIELGPGSLAAYLARAELNWRTGQSEAAVHDAQVALFISSGGAVRAHYVLGQIALEGGDLEAATDHYWRAVTPRYDPQMWEMILYDRRARSSMP